MVADVITTSISRIWMNEEGIAHVELLPDVVIDIEGVTDHFRACEEIGEGRKVPVLVDMRNLHYVDREARMYFAGEVASSLIRAVAVLEGSPVSQIIGRFFQGLNRPTYPIKAFDDEGDAMEWSRGYLE